MENILIALVLIGGLVYNIYTNYRKEMEKTAKRDIRIPVPPVPPQHSPAPVQAVPAVPAASIPEEVVRFQEYKAKKRSTPQPLAISKPVTLVEEESEPFDLRKAVIYAAILERPHK